MRKSRMLSVRLADIPVQKEQAKEILSIGTPAALVNIMQSVSAVLLNQSLLVYGSEKIAAMGIALKVNMIAALVLTGFAYGGQPLFGYYCGADDHKRFHELFHFCSVFIVCMGMILAGLEIVFAPSLIRFFMNTAEIVSDGSYMLRLQAVTMPLMGMISLIMIIFQATGKASAAFVLSLSRQGIVYVLVLLIAQKALGYMGVIASQAIADGISMAIAIGLAVKEHLI
jgi:Na+-driven multidrug efflux pump